MTRRRALFWITVAAIALVVWVGLVMPLLLGVGG